MKYFQPNKDNELLLHRFLYRFKRSLNYNLHNIKMGKNLYFYNVRQFNRLNNIFYDLKKQTK